MNDDRAFERAIDDWLAGGSDRTPRPAVDAVLLAIRTTPQERDLRIPWRNPIMSTPLRLVAVTAVIAVAGFVGIYYLVPGTEPGVGGLSPTASPVPTPAPTPHPSPTPSPTPDPLDTSTWTEYTSGQYDFTMAHPPDWTAVPATRAWTFEADAATPVLTPAADSFDSPGGGVRVGAWSIPVEPAAEGWDALEAWVGAYCPKTDIGSCAGIADRAVPLCKERRDCHATALLVPFDDEVQAFILDGDDLDRMIVVSVWWGESAPAVAPYGGARRLLESFLSTMNVWSTNADGLPPS
jgi:hypothetical protein